MGPLPFKHLQPYLNSKVHLLKELRIWKGLRMFEKLLIVDSDQIHVIYYFLIDEHVSL